METEGDSSRITAIEQPWPRSKVRVLHVDGEPVLRTSSALVKDLGLDIGDRVDLGDLQSRLAEAEPEACRARALRLLEVRDRSRGELANRLEDDGYSTAIVDAVMDRFVEVGLLDDARLASAMVHSLAAGKDYGERRIRADLRRRRIPDTIADQALATLQVSDSEADRALRAAARLARSCREEDGLSQRLARRGFGWDVARGAARTVLSDDGRGPA